MKVLSSYDYYKVYGYTCFYKSSSKLADSIKVDDLTITFVCKTFPREMAKHLVKVHRFTIGKKSKGIYYINGDIILMQLIVTSELSEEDNLWLKSMTDELNNVNTIELLLKEYSKHGYDELYKSVMNIIIRANKERFEEIKGMCEALKELFADELETSRCEGRQEGRQEGIKCMIESSKECGGSWEKVFELVKEKFSSTNEEAEEYMKLYW